MSACWLKLPLTLLLGWDGMGWDGMGWDGLGWGGVGWDGMGQYHPLALAHGSTRLLYSLGYAREKKLVRSNTQAAFFYCKYTSLFAHFPFGGVTSTLPSVVL